MGGELVIPVILTIVFYLKDRPKGNSTEYNITRNHKKLNAKIETLLSIISYTEWLTFHGVGDLFCFSSTTAITRRPTIHRFNFIRNRRKHSWSSLVAPKGVLGFGWLYSYVRIIDVLFCPNLFSYKNLRRIHNCILCRS